MLIFGVYNIFNLRRERDGQTVHVDHFGACGGRRMILLASVIFIFPFRVLFCVYSRLDAYTAAESSEMDARSARNN